MNHPNMSYCAFENTSSALEQCVELIEGDSCGPIDFAEFRAGLSSDYERRGFDKVFELAKHLVDLKEMSNG